TSPNCASASAWSSRSRIRSPSRSSRTWPTARESSGPAGGADTGRAGGGAWVKQRPKEGARGFSGGQQERLGIARAIAVEPDVLLMDEPCSALDPIATARIEELMLELKASYTIIIVTHNMQQAARVSDYTGFMLLGDLVEFGVTRELFTNPREKKTEDYITGRFG